MVSATAVGEGVAGVRAAGSGIIEPSRSPAVLSHAIRAVIVATVAANLVYLGTLLLPGDPLSAFVNIWLSLFTVWLPVGVFWLVAVRTAFRRWEVVLAAAAATFNAAGDTFFSLAMDSSGNLPSPSLADLGYLLYYPLALAALVVLVRRQTRSLTASVVIDSTLAMLGAAAVLAVILAPVFDDATIDTAPIDAAIAALYPLFDLLLVAAVVGICASPVLRIGPRWQYLLIGLLLFTGADIAYALLNHQGEYASGTPLDAAWTVGVAFIAIWVDGVDRDRVQPRKPAASRGRLLPVPALAVLAGLAVLLVATQTEVPTVALVLAAAAVALAAVPVMFRQSMLARVLEGQKQVVERLTALDKSKSDMIGTVSHEMRTPLTSILGFLELVLDDAGGPVPESAKNMLRVADRNAHRLHDLVGNMLILTRLETGDSTTANAPVQIGEVLRRAAETLQPLARSSDVRLSVSGDDSAVVEGDDPQLDRAFTNIMENAIKFTPAEGTVHVDITPDVALAGRPAVMITIADTGMGIPENELPQLFDRFFRASNAREEVVPGTGLGLAIVQGIVHAHGGEIEAESVLGEGTTFRITLPLRLAAG
jgi:signal transduction histidine kinase